MDSGTLLVEPQRPPSALGGEFQTSTARELVARAWTMVEPAAYPTIRILRGALVAVYGPPGAGKSTMLARMLDTLPGPVVLLSAEEHLGPAVGERLARLGVTRDSFHVVGQGSIDDVVALAARARAYAVGIDSVTATPLTPADLRRVIASAKLGMLAGTLQETKAGIPAGSNSLLHEADVVIAVEAGRWAVEKSRYDAAGVAGSVL